MSENLPEDTQPYHITALTLVPCATQPKADRELRDVDLREAFVSEEDARVDANGRRHIKDGLAYLPCILNDTGYRNKTNVTHMTALALDIDGVSQDEFARIKAHLQTLPVEWVAHETTSHGWVKGAKHGPDDLGTGVKGGLYVPDPTNNSCRVVFPFEQPFALDGVNWQATYCAMAASVGLAVPTDKTTGGVDAACTDPSRLFFFPRHIPGAPPRQVWHSEEGKYCIDPEDFKVAGASTAPKRTFDLDFPEPGAGIPIDREELFARWSDNAPASKRKRIEAFRRGDEVGPGNKNGRRTTYRDYSASLMSVLHPTEDSQTACESAFKLSWLADVRKYGGDDHPWEAIQALFTDEQRTKFNPEAVALAREAKKAQEHADWVKFMKEEKASSPAATESAELQDPAKTAPVRLVNLNDLLPEGEKMWPDAQTALAAIKASAQHPVVVDLAGRLVVAEWHPDFSDLCPTAEKLEFVPTRVFIEKGGSWLIKPPTDKPKAKPESAASIFVHHSTPRYTGVCCDSEGNAPPGTYNTWRARPRPNAPKNVTKDDVQPVLDIYHRLTGDDRVGEVYLLKALGFLIQHPTARGESLNVFKSKQGCGKSFVHDMLLKHFAGHSLMFDSLDALSGKHAGANFMNMVVAIAEEVDIRGKEATNRTKSLVTSPWLSVEPKGVGRFNAPNTVTLFAHTNEQQQALDVGIDARRVAVHEAAPPLFEDVRSPEHFAYWKKMADWRDRGGGFEKWISYLMEMPLGDFHPRQVPLTLGLIREGGFSAARGPEGWLDILETHGLFLDRIITPIKDVGQWIPFRDLFRSYCEWCAAQNPRLEPIYKNSLSSLIKQRGWAYRTTEIHGTTTAGYVVVPRKPSEDAM